MLGYDFHCRIQESHEQLAAEYRSKALALLEEGMMAWCAAIKAGGERSGGGYARS